VRFYQRREVKDLIAYLRLVHNPFDEASLLRVLNVPARGIGARTVERLREWARANDRTLWEGCLAATGQPGAFGLTSRTAAGLNAFVAAIESLAESAGQSLGALLDETLIATGYGAFLAGDEEPEERLANVAQLRAVMEQYTDVAGGTADLANFLHDVSLVADVDEMEGEPDAVTLITLHAAKGLEFPVVFIAGMEEGVLPHMRSFDDPRQMEEERRLAYVGITRAEDLLYLTRAYRRFTMGGAMMHPPSRFLTDIPVELTRGWNQRGPRPRASLPPERPTYAEVVAAAPPREEPALEADLQPGTRVRHQKFGEGVVISASKNGSDVEYQVAFDDGAVKRLLQTYARLVRA
jgi:DNA helicase-2/ATP-dependent DNA helicase PcrA